MNLKKLIKLFESESVTEKAPPGAKAERMVKHIKKGYAKDGKLTKKEKGIAYATAWKAKNAGKLDESVDLLDETNETLKHIANRFKYETKVFMQSGHMDKDLFNALYDYYRDKGEMPYAVAKDDPHPWVESKFYQDMGSGMSEGTDGSLNELARLAGLKTEGIGDKLANTAGQLAGKVAAVPGKIAKGAGEMADQFKMGMKDAEIGRQSYAVPTPDIDVKRGKLTPDIPNNPGEKALPPSIHPMNECGDMEMGQKSSMNVSTNMSSDGNKNVTISAEGDQAEALMQMLKLAGMSHDHVRHEEPEIVMAEEDAESTIQVHNFPGMSGRELYDETQTNDDIKDGDVIVGDTGVGIMVSAWPVIVAGEIDGFHRLNAGTSWEEFEGGQYLDSAKRAMEVAGTLEEEFANSPDEEYETVAAITRQGNDLNREKKQFASKPKLGDNPMSGEVELDEELANLLDSVLVSSDMNENRDEEEDGDYGNFGDDPEEETEDQGFFVAIGSEDEGAFVGMVTKEGSKWRERPVAGNPPYNWGQQYMGYLEPRDVMGWINKDYGQHAHVAGPFFNESEAMDYARNYFDMDAGNDYDDEDLDEGIFDTDADLQARSPQYKALKDMEPKYKGTQYEPQLKQRIGAAQARAASGAGEVMDYNPKTGQQMPRPVVPPEQYKAK